VCAHALATGELSLKGPQKIGSLTERARAHSRISRRNNCSPKEDEATQSQEVSLGDVSTHGESLQSHTCCSVENHLSLSLSGGSPVGVAFIAWLDLNCSHLRSVVKKFLLAEACH